MSSVSLSTFNFLLLLSCIYVITSKNVVASKQDIKVVEMAHSKMLQTIEWARRLNNVHTDLEQNMTNFGNNIAIDDCLKLYEDSEPRLMAVLSQENWSPDDFVTWLSAALAGHNSCLDGLEEKGGLLMKSQEAQNLTLLLKEALALYGHKRDKGSNNKGSRKGPTSSPPGGLLVSWNAALSKADIIVSQDGSGNYKTINEAVLALAKKGNKRHDRAIVYVKAGIYHEKVEIGRDLKNVMFVGDGMDRTIVTGNKNVVDGATTIKSATFGVSGDGFWARDITFENTAGPHKHQAVALRVSSDLSVFYRCSFKGYQDTLLAHSLRQFYRDCHVYGTVDFIFGDAVAVLQNCDIFVRKPMDHQSNMITAQGRDDQNENTGISIVSSRVLPSPDFNSMKGKFNNYLGRPWKKYSRTVFLKTNLDGMVHPRGWKEWRGDFALSTLYYGEFMNTGSGASTTGRVKWQGFHVLHDFHEASPFTVRNFIQGHVWIPATGVPFSADI